jgi:hypothetical protein
MISWSEAALLTADLMLKHPKLTFPNGPGFNSTSPEVSINNNNVRHTDRVERGLNGGRLILLLIQSKTDVDIVAGATRQNNTADE